MYKLYDCVLSLNIVNTNFVSLYSMLITVLIHDLLFLPISTADQLYNKKYNLQ